MKIVLNEANQIRAISPCIAQLERGGDFFPCAIALTDVDLIIFSDYEPDLITQNETCYDVKIRIPLESIMTIVYEKIKKNEELEPYRRINVINRIVENSSSIYFLKADNKKVLDFLKEVKKHDIKVKKRKVDESKIY